ncbi:MAG: transposase [Pirellulales bacterium]
MALGKRKREQQELWVATTDLPRSPGHPFYGKLNELLAEAGFDAWIEKLCQPHYAEEGRPGIPPGVYFRMILVGYFEGIGSQRGIAWRCSDSRSLAEFLGLPATDETPDHSSMTRVHKRLPLEIHEQMFQFVLKIADEKGLLKGRTVVVDSTMLEANAAMKSIVRKDTGQEWKDYLRRLMQEQGLIEKDHEPTDEELRRFDQQRKDKTASNDEWESATDPDSRITRMKDKSTHLAYKSEHGVDEVTDLILAAEVYHANHGDTQSMVGSVMQAKINVRAARRRLSRSRPTRTTMPQPRWNWPTTWACGRTFPRRSSNTTRCGPKSQRNTSGVCATIAAA